MNETVAGERRRGNCDCATRLVVPTWRHPSHPRLCRAESPHRGTSGQFPWVIHRLAWMPADYRKSAERFTRRASRGMATNSGRERVAVVVAAFGGNARGVSARLAQPADALHGVGVVRLQFLGQQRDRRGFKNEHQRKVFAEQLAQLVDHPQTQQRVATQLEEVRRVRLGWPPRATVARSRPGVFRGECAARRRCRPGRRSRAA